LGFFGDPFLGGGAVWARQQAARLAGRCFLHFVEGLLKPVRHRTPPVFQEAEDLEE
jgi:hypothetical protein